MNVLHRGLLVMPLCLCSSPPSAPDAFVLSSSLRSCLFQWSELLGELQGVWAEVIASKGAAAPLDGEGDAGRLWCRAGHWLATFISGWPR